MANPIVPNIPATIVALLAIGRLGAIHAVVFGGFAAPALVQRIEACRPVAILTTSASIDGTKPPIPFMPLVRTALISLQPEQRPSRVIVWDRKDEHYSLAASKVLWSPLESSFGERSWQDLIS